MSKEAMKLALEFIEQTSAYLPLSFDSEGMKIHAMLKEALANHIPDATKMVSGVKDSLTTQQEQGEPVAWYIREKDTATTDDSWIHEHPEMVEPLYLHPQQRKPLNDCEVCNHKVSNPDGGHCYMFRKEPEFKCANFDLAMPKCEPQPTLYVKDIDGNFHEYAHEIKG